MQGSFPTKHWRKIYNELLKRFPYPNFQDDKATTIRNIRNRYGVCKMSDTGAILFGNYTQMMSSMRLQYSEAVYDATRQAYHRLYA